MESLHSQSWIRQNQLLLYRDRSGIKPLFYTACEETGTVHFASELKALLACPGIRPEIDRDGLNEIFSIGPARTNRLRRLSKYQRSALPGHFSLALPSGNRLKAYWKLKSLPHTDSFEDTVEKQVSFSGTP